jgi:hypothetical protein
MWRYGTIQRALGSTRLTMTSQYRRETRKSRFIRSMSLRGVKIPVIVLQANESYYRIKGGCQQIRQAATTGWYFWELPGGGDSGEAYDRERIYFL